MENPSLRLSGHVSIMNKTFIVEDCAEDDFGQWAKDECTGEQGHIFDERSCFWTWDDTVCLAVQTIQGPPGEVEKRKGKKEKGKDDPKGPEEHSLVLIVLATVFLMNSYVKGGSCFLCGSLRLRTFQRVAFVLGMRVRHFFQATDRSSTGSVVVTATCATSPLSRITSKTNCTQRECETSKDIKDNY